MNGNDKTIYSDNMDYAAETNDAVVIEEEVTEKDENFARKVVIGTGVGILLGAGTAAAAKTAMTMNDTSDEDVSIDNGVNVGHGVNDNMAFKEAFEAAREEVGPGGVFHWHGNTYSTYSEAEWNSMTDAERSEFGERVKPEVQGDEGNYQTSHHGTQQSAHHTTTHHQHHDDDVTVKPEDPDVELIGVQDQVMEDGSVVTVGAASINGHNVVVVDVNHDSVFDVAYVDANNNGIIEDREVVDISNDHLTVSDFNHLGTHGAGSDAGHNDLANADIETGYDNGDMPDYVNDADVYA